MWTVSYDSNREYFLKQVTVVSTRYLIVFAEKHIVSYRVACETKITGFDDLVALSSIGIMQHTWTAVQ